MIRKSYRQASVHEYINITKQLPSTNPLRSPTPDIHSRKERIEKTLSPIIARSSLKNITNSHKKHPFFQQTPDLDELIHSKDQKISALQKEVDTLKKEKGPWKLGNSQAFSDKSGKDSDELVEKLKEIISSKDEENSELRKRLELAMRDPSDKNDNKIRDILLKFHQEINALKAENKQLSEKLGKGKSMDYSYKPQLGGSFVVETRTIGNNVNENSGNSGIYNNNSNNNAASPMPTNEKSKKAMFQPQSSQFQGGVNSFNEPHALSSTQNLSNEPRLQSALRDKDYKIKTLAEELERINEVLRLKQQENEHLKEKLKKNPSSPTIDDSIHLKQLLQSKLQELEDLKARLPTEDYEKLKALASKTPDLLDEIKRLNDTIIKLRKEQQENQEKIVLLAQEVERLTGLLKQQSSISREDEKVALLAQEIERLNENARLHNAEIQKLRSFEGLYDGLKREHENLSEKYANKNKALESKLKELELLKEKCLLIDKAFSAEKQGLHEKAETLEKKANSLMSENQDLTKLHRKSITDKEFHEQENIKLNSLNHELAQEVKRLTDTLKAKIQEIEGKNLEIDGLRRKLHENEGHKASIMNNYESERKKSQSVIQEHDRKNLLIETLNQEVNSLRSRLLELESKGFSQEKEHEKLKRSHQEMAQTLVSVHNEKDFHNQRNNEKLAACEAELRQKDEDLRELRQKLLHAEQEKAREVAKVRDSISETQLKHEHEKRKTLGVMAERETLMLENEVLKKERSDFQQKCSQLKKSLFEASSEANQMRAQYEESLIKLVIMSAVNESLSDDMQSLRNEVLELSNRYEKLHSEKSFEEIKFKESLNETQKHHEREKRRSIQTQAEKDALSKTLDLVAKDKEGLHKRLFENEAKMIDLQSQNKLISENYEEALAKIIVMSIELERLGDFFEDQSQRQRAEVEEIKREFENKGKALAEWKRKEVEELKNEFENDNRRLLNMVKSLEEHNEALMKKQVNERSEFIAKYEKAMKDTLAKNINDMNASHQKELEKVQERISEHQKIADKYKQELEKMASIMSEKHEEVSNWREKVQKLEQQRLLELEELKKHLELLKNSYVNNPHNLELQAERLAYETNINQLKSRISSLESALKEKTSRQDSQLRDYESRTLELRARLQGFESSKDSELISLREINEKLKGQFDETRERLMRAESEARRLELEIKESQIAISALRSELEQAKKSLELEKLESSRLASRVKEAEIIYRRDIEENLKREIGDRGKELELEIQELSRNRDEYREKAEKNERALTEINGTLIEKIQELEQMKAHYHEAINNVHMLEAKLLEKLQEDEIYIS